jgi:GH15 family glucan-1,4-alpha-glucosidase
MGQPTENHAVIGDLRTVALVALNGTIDFMCWPRFDSPSIFASLLDDVDGGIFEIKPILKDARHRQLYFSDTNVLLTRFLSAGGVAEISDFMPPAPIHSQQFLVRRIKAIRCNIKFSVRCSPRFDYARAKHDTGDDEGTVIFSSRGNDNTHLRLRSSQALQIKNGEAIADFELAAGDTAFFILEDAGLAEQSAALDDDFVANAFKQTLNFWTGWVAKTSYQGRWREVVNRSSLVLKLLTCAGHGAIVAAATFGLPEVAGGDRNWDYRFTWIRDAAFTVYAFLRIGHVDEADAFMRWLRDRAVERSSEDGTLQLMYRLDGGTDFTETSLEHLRGYKESRPVLIGNAAKDQLQLDIYGELMDAIYLSDKYGEQISWQAWGGITKSLSWLESNWEQTDEGIWEIRGERQEFLHSRLMCWVAFDRAVRLARKRSLPGPVEHWVTIRDTIHDNIHAEFWNEELASFVQIKNGNQLDASCLLMPLVRFISPTDPRWLSTLKAVGERLMDDSLVYRYSAEAGTDGLSGVEGTFNMCSFWYVECLARAGDLPKARFMFEKVLGYANHVGLYSEQTGPAGEHMGNFPQALTHLALISAAYYLNQTL